VIERRIPTEPERFAAGARDPAPRNTDLDGDLEAEAQRPVCLQVVAGPRFEPATDTCNGCLPRTDLWITAPKVAHSGGSHYLHIDTVPTLRVRNIQRKRRPAETRRRRVRMSETSDQRD
jgi:hypothetical protein